MKKNLTVTIDSNLKKLAKKYAKDNGVSLSKLTEEYFIRLIKSEISLPKK
jgi:hypothetical protein